MRGSSPGRFYPGCGSKLALFAGIIPSGLDQVELTSIAAPVGESVDVEMVENQVIDAFGEVFGSKMAAEEMDVFILNSLTSLVKVIKLRIAINPDSRA